MESRVFSNCTRNIHRPSTPEKEVNEKKTPRERLAKGDRSRQIRKFIDLSEVLFQHVMFRDKKVGIFRATFIAFPSVEFPKFCWTVKHICALLAPVDRKIN